MVVVVVCFAVVVVVVVCFAAVVVARLPGTGETAFSCECGFDGLAASGAGWAAAAPPSAFRQEWAE